MVYAVVMDSRFGVILSLKTTLARLKQRAYRDSAKDSAKDRAKDSAKDSTKDNICLWQCRRFSDLNVNKIK